MRVGWCRPVPDDGGTTWLTLIAVVVGAVDATDDRHQCSVVREVSGRETAAAPEPVIGDALEKTQSRSKQRTLLGTSGRGEWKETKKGPPRESDSWRTPQGADGAPKNGRRQMSFGAAWGFRGEPPGNTVGAVRVGDRSPTSADRERGMASFGAPQELRAPVFCHATFETRSRRSERPGPISAKKRGLRKTPSLVEPR
ncbi:hypothetical protein HPB47_001379 [Ixodes persulcatus]|uniref:Uncharacterized protein n=1 Tax=Ixodes persulcatus TaxID=34615 RepID=A0AC60PP61_IXOPE|nr:hypothetical protein HPB47_001379 [Ixodes persulcatus]